MGRWQPSRYVDYGLKEDNYEWTQTPEEVTITMKLPDASLHAKDLIVDMRPTHLKVCLKSDPSKPLLEGDLSKSISVDDSTWTKDGDELEITLAKGESSKGDEEGKWWASAIKGHKEVDVKAIESTRFLDESLLKRIWEQKHPEAADQ